MSMQTQTRYDSNQSAITPGASSTVRPVSHSFSASRVIQLTLVTCLLFAAAVCYSVLWDMSCTMPQSIEYEGHVLSACHRLAQGQNIYSLDSLTTLPWSVILYNPLYLALGAALIKTVGLAYLPLRLISMVSFLASCLGLHYLLKRLKVSDLHSLIAVCCFGTYLPVMYWSSIARVDMLALALGIWGMERFVDGWDKAVEKNSIRALIPSAILFVLAFFTKQSGIYFALSAVIFAFVTKRNGLAMRFAGAVLLPTVLIAACIQVLTGGYLAHLSYASPLQWQWKTFFPLARDFLVDPKTIAATMIIAVTGVLRYPQTRERLPIIFIAVCGITSMYTMGLVGAYHNHLLPMILGVVWLMAMQLRKLPAAASTAMIFVALIGMTSLSAHFDRLCSRCSNALPTKHFLDTLRTRPAGEMMLVEDPSFAIFTGATPAIIDATTFFNVAANDGRTIDDIIASIDKQSYSVIALNKVDCDELTHRIWPESVVHAIRRSYYPLDLEVSGNGNLQRIYVPKLANANDISTSQQ